MSPNQLSKVNNHCKHDIDKRQTGNEKDNLTLCGIGSWRPRWLQSMASPAWFLVNMSFVGLIQGMSGPLFIGAMSTLEKRYSFDSKITAIILIADNLSQMMVSPVVGYIGVWFNRSVLMGLSELLMAISCFITASPYFIFGTADHFLEKPPSLDHLTLLNHTTANTEFCSTDRQPQDCSDNRGVTVWLAVVLLFVGSFLRGIGHTAYYVIGFPYLDDNVSKKSSPMYLSIIFSIRLIGPATGYMLSSFVLRFYENPFVDPGFVRTDPRFVGAWWAGFCITGVLLFLSSLPIFLFPVEFKNASVKAEDIQKQMKENGGSVSAVARLLKNKVLMLSLIGASFRYIGIGGYVMFKTKYIESQFRKSSSSASFITGAVSIMPMAIGILFGGACISMFKPRPKTIFICMLVVECFVICAMGTGMLFGCNPIQMQGQKLPDQKFSLSAQCNQNCSCSAQVFRPLCGPDGQSTYFSACHAGCTSYNNHTSKFEDCSCFDGSPTSGYCQKDIDNCHNLYYYLLSILIGAIVSSTMSTAHWLIALRSVAPMDKSFTMGAASSIMAVFAFIPYPLIFGSIVDSVCLVWEEKCDKTGNCWLYDQDRFRFHLHGATMTFMAIGCCFTFTLIFYSHLIKNFYDNEHQDDDNGNNNKTEKSTSNNKTEPKIEFVLSDFRK